MSGLVLDAIVFLLFGPWFLAHAASQGIYSFSYRLFLVAGGLVFAASATMLFLVYLRRIRLGIFIVTVGAIFSGYFLNSLAIVANGFVMPTADPKATLFWFTDHINCRSYAVTNFFFPDGGYTSPGDFLLIFGIVFGWWIFLGKFFRWIIYRLPKI